MWPRQVKCVVEHILHFVRHRHQVMLAAGDPHERLQGCGPDTRAYTHLDTMPQAGTTILQRVLTRWKDRSSNVLVPIVPRRLRVGLMLERRPQIVDAVAYSRCP